MATLTDKQKVYITQQLACWRTPTEVVELVTAEWPDLEIDRRQVYKFNAEGPNCSVSKKLQELFWATRERFKAAAAEIGIAQPAYRLQRLHDIAHRAGEMRNYGLELQALEQAAKEAGGSYGDKRRLELTGADGEPLVNRVEVVVIDAEDSQP